MIHNKVGKITNKGYVVSSKLRETDRQTDRQAKSEREIERDGETETETNSLKWYINSKLQLSAILFHIG